MRIQLGAKETSGRAIHFDRWVHAKPPRKRLLAKAWLGREQRNAGIVPYEIFSAIPVVFLAIVFAKARTQVDPFAFTAYDSRQDENVAAYAPYIIAAKKADSNDEIRWDLLRPVAMSWVAAARRGAIKDLPQASSDDTTSGQAGKSEIFYRCNRIVELLNDKAGQEVESNPDLATRDALLAMRMSAITRRFDLMSIRLDRVHDQASLGWLAMSLPRTTPELRKSALTEIPSLIPSKSDVLATCVRARNLLMVHEAMLTGSAGAKDVATDLPLKVFRTDNLESLAADLQRASAKDDDPSQTLLYGMAGVSVKSTVKLMKSAGQIQKKFRSSEPTAA